MRNIKSGFTLAEALIALLIVSLIITAMIPVLTKKHRKVEEHGKWECTYNGGLRSRTYTNGVPDEWESSNCIFTPPAGAENFKVTVIGGGGGGAGGTGGSFREIFSEEKAGGYFLSVPETGTYYVSLTAGGGSGGGMGCGSPEGINYSNIINNYFPKRYEYDESFDKPGSTDYPDSSFDYKVLYSNDVNQDGTQVVRNYLDTSNQNPFCFSKSDWKEWDLSDPNNCWNWPGQGAYSGGSVSRTVNLKKGQSVYFSVGKGGSRKATYLGNVVVGAMGEGGENSFSSMGDYAYGASAGNARVYTYVGYKNIPMRNCKRKTVTKTRDKIIDHNCDPEVNNLSVDGEGTSTWCTTDTCKAACAAHNAKCSISGSGNYTYCRGTFTETIKDGETYQEIEDDLDNCTKVTRKINAYDLYLPACVMTQGGAGPNIGYEADEPDKSGYTTETDDAGNKEDVGSPGSGGWGAGKHEYQVDDDTKSYLSEDGYDGAAEFHFTSFSGGGGGEAGKIVTTVFKKLSRTTASVGAGGSGSSADSFEDGSDGGDSSFGSLILAEGGKGGRTGAIQSGMVTVGDRAYFPGGNGGYAPLYANLTGHGEFAYGGRNSGRTSDNGMNAFTPLSALNSTTKLVLKFYMIMLQAGVLKPWAIDFFGGYEGDMTYGAGGGGGAGGGTNNAGASYAGRGGNGAAGIIIVEW